MPDATRVVRIVIDARGAKSGADEVQRSLHGIQQTADRALGGVANAVSRLTAAFAALGAGAALKAVIDTTAEFQKLQTSLGTVTGSVELAGHAFEALQKFAAQTPYSVREATEGFIKLKALGLDPSIRSLTSYGNTASAMGKSLNDMVEAVADATTGEFERLKEFGIKSKSEGDKVTFTFQGVSTTIGKSAKDIEGYLRKIGEIQFAGAMEAQSKTLGGAISNLGDAWERMLASIGGAGIGGAAEVGIRSLAEALDGLTRNMQAIVDFATSAATALGALLVARTVAAGITIMSAAMAGQAGAIVGLQMMASVSKLAAAQLVVAGVAARGMAAATGLMNAAFLLVGGPAGAAVLAAIAIWDMFRATEQNVVATKAGTDAAVRQAEAHLIATGKIKDYTSALFGNTAEQKKNLEARLAQLEFERGALQFMASNPSGTNTAADFARITEGLNTIDAAIRQTRETLGTLNAEIKTTTTATLSDEQLKKLKGEADKRQEVIEDLQRELSARQRMLEAVKQGEGAVAALTLQLEKEQELHRLAKTTENDKSEAYLKDRLEAEALAEQIRKTNTLIEDETRKREAARQEIERLANARVKLRQEYDKTVDRFVERSTEATADILFDMLDGKTQDFWDTFLRLGKRAIADLAAESLVKPAIEPMIRSVISAVPAMFGLSAKAGAAGGGSAASGIIGTIGGMMGSAGSTVRSWLNQPIFNAPGAGAAPGSVRAAQETGMPGGSSYTQQGGQMTWGNAAGSAMGGFGAGYAIGGMVGTRTQSKAAGALTGAASGAAAGTMILPGWGTAIGAVMGAVGGLLGTQKDSVGPVGAAIGRVRDGRLEFARTYKDNDFDPTEMKETFKATTKRLNAFMADWDLRLDASRITEANSVITNDPASSGARNVTQLLNRLVPALTGGTGTSATIINTLRNRRDVEFEEVAEGLDFGKTYDELLRIHRGTSDYAESLRDLNTQYRAAMDKAKELGLATGELSDAWSKARRKLRDDLADDIRRATLEANDRGYLPQIEDIFKQRDIMMQSVLDAGLDPNSLHGMVVAQEGRILRSLTADQLRDVIDVYRGTDTAIRATWELERKLAAARGETAQTTEDALKAEQAIRKQADDLRAGAANNLAQFVKSIQFGELSGLGQQDQFALARDRFNAVSGAALAGDVRSIGEFGSFGTTYLQQARQMYGAGAQYAEIYRRVADTAAQLGTVIESDAAKANAEMIVRAQQAGTEAIVTAIKNLQEEVAALRRQNAVAAGTPDRLTA